MKKKVYKISVDKIPKIENKLNRRSFGLNGATSKPCFVRKSITIATIKISIYSCYNSQNLEQFSSSGISTNLLKFLYTKYIKYWRK